MNYLTHLLILSAYFKYIPNLLFPKQGKHLFPMNKKKKKKKYISQNKNNVQLVVCLNTYISIKKTLHYNKYMNLLMLVT